MWFSYFNLTDKSSFCKDQKWKQKMQNDLRSNCNFFQPHWSRMVRVFFTLANQMEAFFQCFFPPLTDDWTKSVYLTFFLSIYLCTRFVSFFCFLSICLIVFHLLYLHQNLFILPFFFFFCCSQFPYIITTFVTLYLFFSILLACFSIW